MTRDYRVGERPFLWSRFVLPMPIVPADESNVNLLFRTETSPASLSLGLLIIGLHHVLALRTRRNG